MVVVVIAVIRKEGSELSVFPIGVSIEKVEKSVAKASDIEITPFLLEALPDGVFVLIGEGENVEFDSYERFKYNKRVRKIISNYLPVPRGITDSE